MSETWIGSARQIGPIGTLARVVGGLAVIVVPIALDGFTVTEAVIALLVLPLVALAAGVAIESSLRRFAPSALSSRHAICSLPACTLIAALIIANVAIVVPTSANGNVTIWVWLGASMLVATARGYSGCEVLAIPNLLTGCRDQIGCLVLTPIDRAEARHHRRAPNDQAGDLDAGYPLPAGACRITA